MISNTGLIPLPVGISFLHSGQTEKGEPHNLTCPTYRPTLNLQNLYPVRPSLSLFCFETVMVSVAEPEKVSEGQISEAALGIYRNPFTFKNHNRIHSFKEFIRLTFLPLSNQQPH